MNHIWKRRRRRRKPGLLLFAFCNWYFPQARDASKTWTSSIFNSLSSISKTISSSKLRKFSDFNISEAEWSTNFQQISSKSFALKTLEAQRISKTLSSSILSFKASLQASNKIVRRNWWEKLKTSKHSLKSEKQTGRK